MAWSLITKNENYPIMDILAHSRDRPKFPDPFGEPEDLYNLSDRSIRAANIS